MQRDSRPKVPQSAGPVRRHTFPAAASGNVGWLRFCLQGAAPPLDTDSQGHSVLHVAALHGQLPCMRLLVESHLVEVNALGPRGQRPVHALLSGQGAQDTEACLQFLLEHGADVNATSNLAQTPLHVASSAGLLQCTDMLVRAGANVAARDHAGCTALDLAHLGGHKKVARYLKDCVWHLNKKKERQRKEEVRRLYQDLLHNAEVNDHREKELRQIMMEQRDDWRRPLSALENPSRTLQSVFHTGCISSEQDGLQTLSPGEPRGPELGQGAPREAWNTSTNPSRPPLASISRPQTMRVGTNQDEPPAEADLRGLVFLSRERGGQPLYFTKWQALWRLAPDLPLDDLQRALFPKDFPFRLPSPRDFQPHSILHLPHLGCPEEQKSTSPWTEVAMHLPEVLEPGHY